MSGELAVAGEARGSAGLTVSERDRPAGLHVDDLDPCGRELAQLRGRPVQERERLEVAEPRVAPEVEGFLRAALDEVPPPREALARARELDRQMAERLELLLPLTVSRR